MPVRRCGPAQSSGTTAFTGDGLRSNGALLVLDYQVIQVPGDAPIDLMGFHVHSKLREGLNLGAGGFVKASIGLGYDLGPFAIGVRATRMSSADH